MPRVKKLKESDYQKLIMKFMETNGFLVFKLPPSIYSSRKGLPDLVCIRRGDGLTVWLEVKTPTGRLSKSQEKLIAEMREAGAHVHVVRGYDEAHLTEILTNLPPATKKNHQKTPQQ